MWCPIYITATLLKISCFHRTLGMASYISWLEHTAWGARILMTAMTFICAAIHFRAVYNLQHPPKPVPLIPSLHGVGVKDPLSL